MRVNKWKNVQTNSYGKCPFHSHSLTYLTTVNPTHLAHSYLIGLKIKTK